MAVWIGATVLAPGGAVAVTFETIQQFSAVQGVYGRPIQGSDGKLYGAGSAVFRVSPDGTAFEVLHAFSCETDGCGSGASLTAGRDGRLYGTTFNGGPDGGGTVFRVNPDGRAFEVLHAFICATDGCASVEGSDLSGPGPSLTEGRDGKFYGTASTGGPAGGGTVFRVNPDGSAFEVLHAFTCDDWCTPIGGLTAGRDGKFYGTTYANGDIAFGGSVFRVNPDGTGFEVLHVFGCDDGCFPIADLTEGRDGKFYGTTQFGGARFRGTVFRLNPDGTGFQVLHAFSCAEGCNPVGGLTAGSDGKFYGTTLSGGGASDAGVVFRVNPDGTAFEVLHAFSCESSTRCGPSGPNGGLTLGRDGRFYGNA